MPWALHEEAIRSTHDFEVFMLRSMLSVPYFEKELYETPDSMLTPEHVAALADRIEERVQGGLASRPLLSVPHILSDEASCYYHGTHKHRSLLPFVAAAAADAADADAAAVACNYLVRSHLQKTYAPLLVPAPAIRCPLSAYLFLSVCIHDRLCPCGDVRPPDA